MEPVESFEQKLISAVTRRQTNAVKELLEQWREKHGVYPYIGEVYDSFRDPVLFIAVRSDNPELVKALLKATTNPDAADGSGITPLTFLLQTQGDLEILRELIKAGVNVNRADYDGDGLLPLHIACQYANIEAIKLLVQAGADVNMKDKRSGKTAADVARPDMREEILEALKDVRKEFNDVLRDYIKQPKKEAYFEHGGSDALFNLKHEINNPATTREQIVNKLQIFCQQHPAHPITALIQAKIPVSKQAPSQPDTTPHRANQ